MFIPPLFALPLPQLSPDPPSAALATPGLLSMLTGGAFSSTPRLTEDAMKDARGLDPMREKIVRLVDNVKGAVESVQVRWQSASRGRRGIESIDWLIG